MKQQHSLMLFDPWVGTRRDARDVGSDPFGLLSVPDGESIYADATK